MSYDSKDDRYAEEETQACEGAVTDIDALYNCMQQRTDQLAETTQKRTDVLAPLRYLKVRALNAGIEAARSYSARLPSAVNDPAEG